MFIARYAKRLLFVAAVGALWLSSAGQGVSYTPPVPCDCQHLIDLKDMIRQIDLYILGYETQAYAYQAKGKTDPSADVFRVSEKNKVDAEIRSKITGPARYPPAYGFGGGTDPITCAVTLKTTDACLASLTDLHEQHHATICKLKRPVINGYFDTFVDNATCIGTFISKGIGCGYQSDEKLSNAFFEEVTAYKLQRDAAQKQLEIARQDLIRPDRQLTCEKLLKDQVNRLWPADPNNYDYKLYLMDVVGQYFTWLLP